MFEFLPLTTHEARPKRHARDYDGSRSTSCNGRFYFQMWIVQNVKLIIFDRIQRNFEFHAILHRFHLCDY